MCCKILLRRGLLYGFQMKKPLTSVIVIVAVPSAGLQFELWTGKRELGQRPRCRPQRR